MSASERASVRRTAASGRPAARAGSTRRKVSSASEEASDLASESTEERPTTSGRRSRPVRKVKAPRKARPVPVPEEEPDDEDDLLALAQDDEEDGPEYVQDAELGIPTVPDDVSELHSMADRGTRARPTSRNLDPSALYRGRTRLALLRDLAMAEWSDAAIAKSVGVPTEIITDFRLTYEAEVSEVRASLAGQLAIESAGLWISKKQNRLAELQQDFEDIDLVIDAMRENTKKFNLKEVDGRDTMVKGDEFDANMLLGSRRHQNLLRSKIAILKAAADELMQRGKEKDDTTADNSIRYVIEQEDTGDDILGSLT